MFSAQNYNLKNSFVRCVKAGSVSFFMTLTAINPSFAQKYNFVNWTVEDGLIQSQASYICQDRYRQLWIGTEGGVSRFDGKKFTGYTVQDGLVENHINTILCDSNYVWLGTNLGISVYDGRSFRTIKSSEQSLNSISEMVQLKGGTVYAIDNYSLLLIRDFNCEKILVSGDSNEKVTAIYRSESGGLLCSVYKKGLYVLKNKTWEALCSVNESQKKTSDPQHLYFFLT